MTSADPGQLNPKAQRSIRNLRESLMWLGCDYETAQRAAAHHAETLRLSPDRPRVAKRWWQR